MAQPFGGLDSGLGIRIHTTWYKWPYYPDPLNQLRIPQWQQFYFGYHYTETVSGGLKLGGAADESLVEGSNTYNETMSGGVLANSGAVNTARYTYPESGHLEKVFGDWDTGYEILTEAGQSAYMSYAVSGGHATFSSTNKATNQIEYARGPAGYTWTDIFGVPAYGRVYNVELAQVVRKCSAFQNCTTAQYGVSFIDPGNTSICGVTSKSLSATDADWVVVTGWTLTDPTRSNQLAGTQIRLQLNVWLITNQTDPTNFELAFDSAEFRLDWTAINGGTACSGQADVSVVSSRTVSGGTTANGSATVAVVRTYNEIMSGGVVLSGLASVATGRTFYETMSGGLILLNSSGLTTVSYRPIVSGGAKASGLASVLGIGSKIIRCDYSTELWINSELGVLVALDSGLESGPVLAASSETDIAIGSQTAIEARLMAALLVQ